MSVWATMVTFYPERTVVDNVAALLEQVERILIVDNGTTGDCADYVEQAAALSDRIELIRLGENIGVAGALNRAVEWAMDTDCVWLLEMDQDSRVTPHMVDTMLATYDAYPEPGQVAMLCPVPREVATGTLIEHEHRGQARRDARWREVLWAITSGSLTKMSVLAEIGLYDEELFIDCVDADYCLRCDQAGFRILEVAGAVLEHRRGQQTRHRIAGKTVYTSNHSALRRYYIARNRVLMVRRYIFKYPVVMFRFVLGLAFYHFITVVLWEQDKLAKLRYLGRGLVHGIVGVGGRLGS